jgi:serine protease Do
MNTATRLLQGWIVGILIVVVGAPAAAAAALPDFTELVRDQSPAVVNISTVQRARARRRNLPDDVPEFFRRYFEGPPGDSPFQPRRESLGSGFVIDEEGYVLTNHHVVDGAEEIFVRLSDRRELEAEIVGTDERSDLALLKVEADGLKAVRLGSSSDVEPGQWVLAIGSPFGFDYSVTAGIVSAKGRSLPTAANENYVPFLQTDVAINPGNSGGPLFNLDGEVVAINAQIYTRTGGFMGVSFHIPIDLAMEVVEQLRENGRVSRGWLGVAIQEIDRELAESFGLDKAAGALVSRVFDDSPAAAAGLQRGDIIVEFDGVPIELSGDLPHVVGRTRAGQEVDVVVMRDGRRRTLSVTVGELSEGAGRVTPTSGGADAIERMGVAVEDVDPQDLERAGVDGGVIVTRILGDNAREAGLRRGDLISRVGRTEIADLAALREALAGFGEGERIPVLITRGGTSSFLSLQLD